MKRSYTKMTPELKKKIVEMLANDCSVKEIMQKLGISRQSLYNHLDLEKYGLNTKMTPELKEKIGEMLANNCSVEEIMQKLGISRQSLYNHDMMIIIRYVPTLRFESTLL